VAAQLGIEKGGEGKRIRGKRLKRDSSCKKKKGKDSEIHTVKERKRKMGSIVFPSRRPV
jgi:hypothetical protein